jgi:hypothetical protein
VFRSLLTGMATSIRNPAAGSLRRPRARRTRLITLPMLQ